MQLFFKTCHLIVLSAFFAGIGIKNAQGQAGSNSPASFFEKPVQAILNEDVTLLWDALPASYQADVNNLIHQAAGNVDVDLYNKVFSLLGQVGQLLESKGDLVFEMLQQNPMLAQGASAEDFKNGAAAVTGILNVLANSDIADLEKVKTLDVGAFANETGGELLRQIASISKTDADDPWENEVKAALRNVEVEVLSEDGDSATIKVSGLPEASMAPPQVPGAPPMPQMPEFKDGEYAMTKVDGKWIPEDLANQWAPAMEQAKADLVRDGAEPISISDKAKIMRVLDMVDDGMTNLNQSGSAQEMGMAVQQLMMTIMTSGAGAGFAEAMQGSTGGAGVFTKEDGTTYEGEVAKLDEDGIIIRRMDINEFSPLIDLVHLNQETLLELVKNPKYRNSVAPFIDLPEDEIPAPPEVNVRQPDRMERAVAGGSFLSSFVTTPIGILLFVGLMVGNLLAAHEIAVYRGKPVALVCGLSVILPILAPIVFLSMHGSAADAFEPSGEAFDEGATAAAGGGKTTAAVPAKSKLGLAAAKAQGGGGAATTTTYTANDTTFNRHFFETKFSDWFRVVPSASIKDMVIVVKTVKREYVGKRISRISANDLHLNLQQGNKEVSVSFGELVQVEVRPK